MKNKIKRMLELQDEANTLIHPDWRNQGFEWYRAIWVECAELMDHYGWKWWKKQGPDVNQVKLELVDIWHFGLSIMLSYKYENGECGSAEHLAHKIHYQFLITDKNEHKKRTFLQVVDSYSESTLNFRGRFELPLMRILMHKIGMSFDELYKLYVGKNVLNKFRQANGYKEGTYQKIWNGKEDNEVLYEILERLDCDDDEFEESVGVHLMLEYQAQCIGMRRGDL